MPYSGDPSSSPVNEIRFLIGDTADPPELADAEIQYYIDKYGMGINGAIACINALLAKFSQCTDESINGASKSYSQLTTQYRELKKDLEKQLANNLSAPAFAGGISFSDKENTEQDPDRVKPKFTKDQFEPAYTSDVSNGLADSE